MDTIREIHISFKELMEYCTRKTIATPIALGLSPFLNDDRSNLVEVWRIYSSGLKAVHPYEIMWSSSYNMYASSSWWQTPQHTQPAPQLWVFTHWKNQKKISSIFFIFMCLIANFMRISNITTIFIFIIIQISYEQF